MLTKNIISVALALLASEAAAHFRMDFGALSFERVDPIDAPGKPAGHSHAIVGANNFNMLSSHESLLEAECTTCEVPADKSSYWVPNMYWERAEDKKLVAVSTTGSTVYYFLRIHDGTQDIDNVAATGMITPFPPGFRMIGGHTTARGFKVRNPDLDTNLKETYQNLAARKLSQFELSEYAIGFNCINYDKNGVKSPWPVEDTAARGVIPQFHGDNGKETPTHHLCDTIRSEFFFPSCWTGKAKDIDSPNHKDHVAYPDTVIRGKCPKSHPVQLPTLLIETWYNTLPFQGQKGRFVMSNGDTGGRGYHGDFMNGWDQKVLESAVKTCTNDSGKPLDCPAFNGFKIDIEKGRMCKKKTFDFPDEDCEGPLGKLPGKNNIDDTYATHEDGATPDDGAGYDTEPDVPGKPDSKPIPPKESSVAPPPKEGSGSAPGQAPANPPSKELYAQESCPPSYTKTVKLPDVTVTETQIVIETGHHGRKKHGHGAHRRRARR